MRVLQVVGKYKVSVCSNEDDINLRFFNQQFSPEATEKMGCNLSQFYRSNYLAGRNREDIYLISQVIVLPMGSTNILVFRFPGVEVGGGS